MASASVIGFHLAASGKRLLGLPPVCSLLPLAATCILLKSVNAWLLMATGLLLQRLTRRLGSGIAMWALGVLIVCYIAVRAAGFWSGGALVDAAAAVIGEDRARSLGFRFENESVLAQKARERPLLGWGGWGRHMVYDFEGNPLTVSDSLWIIAFGMYGSVGLAAVTGCLLAPVAVFLKRCRPRGRPGDERTLPAEALACVLLLYTVDHLVNAMVNPVFMLIAGGLAGIHCPADHPPACPEEASTHGTA